MRNFAPANSRRAISQEAGAVTGREYYILECVADALFLATLNLGNSNVQFKDNAEVGAAGRYIPSRWRAED